MIAVMHLFLLFIHVAQC